MDDDDIHLHLYKKDVKFNDALVITSTVGVSSIVADYLIEHLELELIGVFYSELMFAGCEVKGGKGLSPFQIWAGEYRDIEGTDFDQIVLVTTKFSHEDHLTWQMSNKILNWSKEINATAVLTMTPLYRQELQLGAPVNVYHVLSHDSLNKYTPHLRSTSFEEGSLSGMTGVMLYMGSILDVPVMTLIAEVHPDFRDSRAAAAILQTVNQLVPKIDMDHEPLLKEAEQIEEQIMMHARSMSADQSTFA